MVLHIIINVSLGFLMDYLWLQIEQCVCVKIFILLSVASLHIYFNHSMREDNNIMSRRRSAPKGNRQPSRFNHLLTANRIEQNHELAPKRINVIECKLWLQKKWLHCYQSRGLVELTTVAGKMPFNTMTNAHKRMQCNWELNIESNTDMRADGKGIGKHQF